jgi:hypothetical protein
MANPAFSLARHINEQQCCDAPGCRLPRTTIERFCKTHRTAYVRYGHPAGAPLKPAAWAPIATQVRSLLSANADHPGTQQVRQFLSNWMATATANENAFYGAQELARISRHGVNAMDVLVEVCAFWTWLQRNPHALPQGSRDSDRAVDFAVSRAVFALAPRPKRVSWHKPGSRAYSTKARSSGLAYIGKHLRQTLAPFLVNVAHSIQPEEVLKAKAAEAMRAPFRSPF